MIKKRDKEIWSLRFCILFVLVVLIVLFNLIISINSVSALGVSPAKEEFNFKPGLEKEINFKVGNSNSDKEISIYVEEGLSEYISFDKDELPIGGGNFVATIKLPQEMDKPGRNIGYIVIKEKQDENQKEQIAALTAIRVPIVVNVPYPGKYIEIKGFGITSVNTGEEIEVNVALENKGSTDLNVNSKVDIYYDNKKVKTINFEEKHIKVEEIVKLYDIFNSSTYLPGEYTANLTINFGKDVIATTSFRIGYLSVKILNHTQKIPINGTRPFMIDIQSEWGEKIENVYADVVILENFNGTLKQKTNFRTNPSSVDAWKETKITGFFQADGFEIGKEYTIYMTMNYFGQGQEGQSKPQKGTIMFYEIVEKESFLNKERILTLLVIVLSIMIILISISYIWKKK